MNMNRHAFRGQKPRLLPARAQHGSLRSLEAPSGDFQPIKTVQHTHSCALRA
jgi:hypothetical protein